MGDSSTPQSRAIEWLINNDSLQLCPGDATFVQRYSLAVLYYATNGDSWQRCSQNESTACGGARFLSGVSECQWTGVSCDNAGDIAQLNIGTFFSFSLTMCLCVYDSLTLFSLLRADDNNLAGALPMEIGSLSRLFELDFDSNALTGTIPSELGQLSVLVYLDLDENRLSGTIPQSLYGLSLLRSFDLDTNRLVGTISTEIGMLTDLYIAQLDNNLLTGTIPTEIAQLTALEFFTILGNFFDGPIPAEVCDSTIIKVYANCEQCTIDSCCEQCV